MNSNSEIHSIDNIPKPGKLFLVILGILMAFTSLSTDVYLPAMPEMHKELRGNIELTITGFLIGFSIAQIIWGPVSDKYGRRLPLFLGIGLFVIGSVGCALSGSMIAIVCWRVIQALGACTGPMISRAMVRDMYGRTKAAATLSTLMIVMAIAPIIGPLLGGQLLRISSWHSIFWLLAGIGCIMLLSIIWLPETLSSRNRSQNSISTAFGTYRLLLANRSFMRYTLCVTFFYVGAYAFIAGSPFVYITYFNIAPQHYGWLFALNVAGIMGLSFVNRILVNRYTLDFLLRVSTTVAMIAGMVLAVLVRLEAGGVLGVVIPVFFFFSMNGIIAACATAAALDDVPEMAGAASALLGCLQYGSGILSTLLLTWFGNNTPWTMSWIIAVFTTAAAVIIRIAAIKPVGEKLLPERKLTHLQCSSKKINL
jgi:DHA1 family bicyclomycin/chloramphenicol resistance-like MFS transporter